MSTNTFAVIVSVFWPYLTVSPEVYEILRLAYYDVQLVINMHRNSKAGLVTPNRLLHMQANLLYQRLNLISNKLLCVQLYLGIL